MAICRVCAQSIPWLNGKFVGVFTIVVESLKQYFPIVMNFMSKTEQQKKYWYIRSIKSHYSYAIYKLMKNDLFLDSSVYITTSFKTRAVELFERLFR